MARPLVVSVDVQHFVDEFESLIQSVLGQVEPRCGEQRSRLGGCKSNQIPRAGFGVGKTAQSDQRVDDLYRRLCQ